MPAAAPKPVEKPPVVAAPARVAASPPVRIEVTSDDKMENRLRVSLHFTGGWASVSELAFRSQHGVTLFEPIASDERGPVRVSQDEDGLKLSPGEPRSELHVRYSLKLDPTGTAAGAPFSESIELQVAGEDLLALPRSDEKVEVALEIKTGGTVTGGASSFGLGHARTFTARFEELRGAFFIGGDVGTAQFHAGDGDDVTAWIGHTAFDPRWVGAEVAATRAAVDVYVGRQHAANGPPLALLIVPTKRDDPPVVIMPRSRGFLVSVDRRAVWNAASRILVGQALAQRYLGGFVSLGPRDGAAAGLWNDGFARAVGREVVFEMGMIDATDRAADVNQLLFAETFSTDPKRQLSIRGALLATALGRRLQTFVRERLQEAARANREEIPIDVFKASVGAALFDAKEIPIPGDLLGKCWRLERKTLVPFQLGFETSAGDEMRVTSLVVGSRAEAAGLRLDDVIEKIDYRPGWPDHRVTLTIRRGAKSSPLSFFPAGAGKPGRVFTRVAGIPDDRCG